MSRPGAVSRSWTGHVTSMLSVIPIGYVLEMISVTAGGYEDIYPKLSPCVSVTWQGIGLDRLGRWTRKR